MNSKPWYQSLTLWTNLVGLLIVVLQYLGTINLIDPDTLATILGVLNIVLRLKTSQPVKLS